MNAQAQSGGALLDVEIPSTSNQSQTSLKVYMSILMSAVQLARHCNSDLNLNGHLDPKTIEKIKTEVLQWS